MVLFQVPAWVGLVGRGKARGGRVSKEMNVERCLLSPEGDGATEKGQSSYNAKSMEHQRDKFWAPVGRRVVARRM